jgi:hypothetical protein
MHWSYRTILTIYDAGPDRPPSQDAEAVITLSRQCEERLRSEAGMSTLAFGGRGLGRRL